MSKESRIGSNSDEYYISVDIEASGPIPGKYSMLSIGACSVYDELKTFYLELKPLNDNYIPEALSVSGLSLISLRLSGIEPSSAMKAFLEWVLDTAGKNIPVFVGFNTPFDWQFVNWYFYSFIGRNPFGINALDIKAYYMGKFGTNWSQTSSSKLPSWLQVENPMKHNALQDAIAQAKIFRLVSSHRSELD